MNVANIPTPTGIISKSRMSLDLGGFTESSTNDGHDPKGVLVSCPAVYEQPNWDTESSRYHWRQAILGLHHTVFGHAFEDTVTSTTKKKQADKHS